MKLNADNVIEIVGLNRNTAGNFCFFDMPVPPAGNFDEPPWSTSYSGNPGCFRSGKDVNELIVRVRNADAGSITGLIVDGKVTYDDCDERTVVQDFSGLQSITFWESTFATPDPPHTIPVGTGSPLNTRIAGSLGPGAGGNDFVGVPLVEFYDVFYSDCDGSPNLAGQFVTIEAVSGAGAPSGGGLNIAAVRLDLPGGGGLFANSVCSFVALGDNAILTDTASPPSVGVGTAVDGPLGLNTDTTMGNTSIPAPPPLPATQRLRLTVGFPCGIDTIPTVSEWGLFVLLCGGLAMGTVRFGRRRIAPA